MSKAKLWEGPVFLEPINHVYIHKTTGKKYKSVTTTLSSIEPHFDVEGVSASIFNQLDNVKNPIYVGMSQQQIKDYWQMLNDEANVYGTMVHDIVEKYLLKNNKFYFPEDPFEQKVIDGYNNLGIEEGVAIWPERILFAEQYELAGMSDLIIDIDDVYFDIWDWKTNRIFNFFNQYGNETLFKPFSHLQACQYSIYSLQLSVYAYIYMLEFPNRKCRSITIGYWDKELSTFSRIPIMFMIHEAKKIIELHHYNIMKNI